MPVTPRPAPPQSWLATGVYARLGHKEYLSTAPAGAWWEQGPPRLEAAPASTASGRSLLSLEPDDAIPAAIARCLGLPPFQPAPSPTHHGTTPAPASPTPSPPPAPPAPPHAPAPPYPRAPAPPSPAPAAATATALTTAPTSAPAPTPIPPRLVLHNLFALEAAHAAEALGVRSAAAAPYQIPYRCPAGFEAAFRGELPQLYRDLTALAAASQREEEGPYGRGGLQGREPDERQEGETEVAGGGTAAPVTFAEVSHWLWPLFTERWGEWRERLLRLPPLPLHDRDTGEPLTRGRLPPAPPLLYGFSERVVPRPPYWPPSVTLCGFWQPPLGWFEGERLTPPLESFLAAAAADPSCARLGLRSTCVCVDLGSMGRLGLIPDPPRLLRVLEAALAEVGLVGLMLTAGWEPLHAAAAAAAATSAATAATAAAAPTAAAAATASASPGAEAPAQATAEVEGLAGPAAPSSEEQEQPRAGKRTRRLGPADPPGTAGSEAEVLDAANPGSLGPSDSSGPQDPAAVPNPNVNPSSMSSAAAAATSHPRLFLQGRDVPHTLLLPRCAAVLHHGGSGTTAAALLCGVPQVTCPCQFDQPFWAERVAYMGLGPEPLDRGLLLGLGLGPDGPSGGSGARQRAGDLGGRSGRDEAAAVRALAAALRDALQPARRRAAQTLAEELKRERGLDVAVAQLERLLGPKGA
ncbi:hypothetical protein HYH03_011361 [Edaphochlamys debaryana]|uniref:Erythromycin biosynthesis protein CIII-like C-terminal domain-containing protein n=1 Tax=Edaphochlamys debaryana TaxID=47281 RepID=A0A835XV57_9CHLO|nr:hypothetical protein HYH03_011361 [Edaphochlamys debaryana]|eukprot:KAG2490237.1 hypothetical protein HYH03_011361 [Edaphochlamys debaryana]